MNSTKEDFLLLQLFVYFLRHVLSLTRSAPGMITTSIEWHICIKHIRVPKLNERLLVSKICNCQLSEQ